VYDRLPKLLATWVYRCTLREPSTLRPLPLSIMFTQDRLAPPTFQSSSVVIDWTKDKLQKKFDSASLLQWVQSFPSRDDVHIYLGNVSFHGDRVLMRQLQALGCTVTSRQYQG